MHLNRMVKILVKSRKKTFEKCLEILILGQITTYPLMVWPKFKLTTCGLKFDTLPPEISLVRVS